MSKSTTNVMIANMLHNVMGCAELGMKLDASIEKYIDAVESDDKAITLDGMIIKSGSTVYAYPDFEKMEVEEVYVMWGDENVKCSNGKTYSPEMLVTNPPIVRDATGHVVKVGDLVVARNADGTTFEDVVVRIKGSRDFWEKGCRYDLVLKCGKIRPASQSMMLTKGAE